MKITDLKCYDLIAARLGTMPEGSFILVVDASVQRLYVFQGFFFCMEFRISTSKLGLGEQEGSHQTPRGWHEVVERMGDGEPLGRVFVSREPQPEIIPPSQWNEAGDRDLILTRILRLAGCESGVNQGLSVDSYDRYIYIHGTNQEQWLGTPASHGCIRMGNQAMVELFDKVKNHPVLVYIFIANERE